MNSVTACPVYQHFKVRTIAKVDRVGVKGVESSKGSVQCDRIRGGWDVAGVGSADNVNLVKCEEEDRCIFLPESLRHALIGNVRNANGKHDLPKLGPDATAQCKTPDILGAQHMDDSVQ